MNEKEKLPVEMVVINKGEQGMSKDFVHAGGKVEGKTFMPDCPVGVTKLLGEYLLKKYNSPSFKVFFQEAKSVSVAEVQEAVPKKKERKSRK